MPKKEWDLMTRKKVTLTYARRYQKTQSKKEKSQILDEFTKLTGYNRSYASWLLRHAGKRIFVRTPHGSRFILIADPNRKIKRKRPKTYDHHVLKPLIKIWAILDFPCSLKLKAMLPKIIPKLEKHGELSLNEEVRNKLLQISKATIDRLLAPERKRLKLKPKAKTKPGTLLKNQIPIRTFGDWKEDEPGFVEVDLVSHDGGLAMGDHAWSLVLTDISTQWTEVVPLKNRAQVWAFEALKEASLRMPFPLKGIDSDNDGAFINYHLLRWCQESGIVFTRSRPYHKNDNCYVEQKNWTVARRYFGYFRYDTEESLKVLKELSELLSLYVNFFQVSVRVKEKRREGSKVRRVYDEPKTPFERVLEHQRIPEMVKEELRRRYEGLNPAELRRRILRLQRRLFRLATPVKGVVYE
jgi:hypothetical protein